MNMWTYAGIGSRETPESTLRLMTKIAASLESRGWTLSSGGARGADSAFEAGVTKPEAKTIYRASDATDQALYLASMFHPAWDKCSPYAKNLHARNMFIILGPELNRPVKMIICWTPDGKATGGTGQAIRAALQYKIPVFNLFNQNALEHIKHFIGA